MNRRTAMQSFAAFCAAPFAFLTSKAKAAPNWTRDETDLPEREGVAGESYFLAGATLPMAPRRVYLDGVDVTNRSNECDTVGGWVRMFDIDDNGKRILVHPERDKWRGARTYFGRVEVR